MILALLLSLTTFAGADLASCVSQIEADVAMFEGVTREEQGEPVGELKCKLKVIKQEEMETPSKWCEFTIDYTYTCSPGEITGEGSGCCQSE